MKASRISNLTHSLRLRLFAPPYLTGTVGLLALTLTSLFKHPLRVVPLMLALSPVVFRKMDQNLVFYPLIRLPIRECERYCFLPSLPRLILGLSRSHPLMRPIAISILSNPNPNNNNQPMISLCFSPSHIHSFYIFSLMKFSLA